MTPARMEGTATRGVDRLDGAGAVVVGLGRSGVAAARFLAARGARVVGNDTRARPAMPAEEVASLEAAGVRLVLGGHPDEAFDAADLVVVSPGVPPLEVLDRVEARGVPVWSEIELAWRFVEAPVLAITGTNGKSTVTAWLGDVAARRGGPSFVGGNLGVPLIEAVGTPAAAAGGLLVVETSSFQLERVDAFRPRVAALLNVTEDHLDRYADFAAYAAAKARIFHAQGEDDVAVAPADDALCASIARTSRARQVRFGGADGAVRVEGDRLRSDDRAFELPVGELRVRGRHNLANACAVAAIARAAGLPDDALLGALADFEGLPHRMRLVGERGGVSWFDDSKATNVGAALAALDGLADDPRIDRVVLLLGGVDKGGSYAPLRARAEAVARAVVLFGEASPLIERAFEGSAVHVEPVGTLERAVQAARALARPGDAVLLAPACASFDQFRSYAHRGDRFAELVAALDGGPP